MNVGKSGIRHRTTLNLNDAIFNRFPVNPEIQFQFRSMSDPTLSDNDFKNKLALVRTTLNQLIEIVIENRSKFFVSVGDIIA